MKRFFLVLLSVIICSDMAAAAGYYDETASISVDLSVLGDDEEVILDGNFYDDSSVSANEASSKAGVKKSVNQKKAVLVKSSQKSQNKIVLKNPKSKKIVLKKPGARYADGQSAASEKIKLIPPRAKAGFVQDSEGVGIAKQDTAEADSQKLLARGPIKSVNNRLVFDFNVDVATRPATASLVATDQPKVKGVRDVNSLQSEREIIKNQNVIPNQNVDLGAKEMPAEKWQNGNKPNDEIADENQNKTAESAGEEKGDVKADSEPTDSVLPKAAKTEKVTVDDLDAGVTPADIINKRMAVRSNGLNADDAHVKIQQVIDDNGGNILVFNFANDVSQIADGEDVKLHVIADALRNDPLAKVRLISYASDTQNHSAKAREISLARAVKLRDMLVKYGAPSDQVEVRALGNRVSRDVIFLEIVVE